MATVYFKKGKTKTRAEIQFKLMGAQRTLSLGSKYNAPQIARIKNAVEDISEAIETGGKPGKATAGFIAEMPTDLKARFINAGLLEEPRIKTNKALWNAYLREVERNRKEGTWVYYDAVGKRFLKHFPENGNPGAITKEDGERWKQALIEADFAPATVANSLRGACAVFNWAVNQGVIEANPFKGIKRGANNNPERMFYVSMDWYRKLLEACPSQSWRTLLALCRIGGLRNPSETSRLTWDKVNWETGAILIESPKTEHHAGKESRVIPMFPELLEELKWQRELTEEGGSPYVIPNIRWENTSLARNLKRIIFSAGLPRWERLWQNLRESRANELWTEYPRHVAAAWMGHSERVAMKHYLQVTDEQFQKALRGAGEPAKKIEETGGRESSPNILTRTN
jgi:integrase